MVAQTQPDAPLRRSAFRHGGFAAYYASRLIASFAVQISSVAVGWQVYDLTHSTFALGMIGLVQFLPSFLLVLVTGHVADRYNRRLIMAACVAGEAMCGVALLLFTLSEGRQIGFVFAIMAALGLVRAFFGPAQQALVPNLVPAEDLANAIAWNSSSWQIATILGPVAGGLLYGVSSLAAYGTTTALLLAATALVLFAMPNAPRRRRDAAAGLSAVVAGFRFVWSTPIVLGAISFDLFAVLLGGATALMPAYARDILAVGPWGLGLLRAAPGLGALAVAAWLAVRPIRDHAGRIMFVCVALFGLSTTVFGVSRTVWISVGALALAGGLDMVSVYVRETLIQLWTPDGIRGRVGAVNQVFIGASNELGEFRAGISATMFGLVPAVVIGGLGTLAIAAMWFVLFPELGRARWLDARALTQASKAAAEDQNDDQDDDDQSDAARRPVAPAAAVPPIR